LWQGLHPVFCDIDPDTLCLSVDRAAELINENTSAIMGVHVYGRSCDTRGLQRLAGEQGLRLIFDAAHSMGCSHEGQPIGGFGDCEVFSFHATKVFNTLEGGAITTNDEVLAERLRRLRNFGFPGDGSESTVELGTNAKLNEVCAAVGLANLECLDEFIAANRRAYEAYSLGLEGIPGLSLLDHEPEESSNFQYVIALIDESEFGASRDDLKAALAAQGILARRYFSPGCHSMSPYSQLFPDAAARLPVTERITCQTLALPTGAQLTPKDIEFICATVRHFPSTRRSAVIAGI
jgi:dTDP-4-amino-4,6-dideoxygalactose transaminase